MALLDGIKALAVMKAKKTWSSAGKCLAVVDYAFGGPYLDRSDGKGNYLNAIQVWDRTAEKYRRTDRPAPKGTIVLFRNKNNRAKGHIAISLGDGRMRSTTGTRTDWDGLITVFVRANPHLVYLGWMTHYTAPHPIIQGQNIPILRAVLKRGATGESVGIVQDAVNHLYSQRAIELKAKLTRDKIMGPLTETGVKLLQAWGGLKVTGVVDEATWAVVDLALIYTAPPAPEPEPEIPDEPALPDEQEEPAEQEEPIVLEPEPEWPDELIEDDPVQRPNLGHAIADLVVRLTELVVAIVRGRDS